MYSKIQEVSKKNCADIITCKSQFLPVRLTSFRCMVQNEFSRTAMSVPGGVRERGREGGRSKTGHVTYNVTWRSVRETTVAVEGNTY